MPKKWSKKPREDIDANLTMLYTTFAIIAIEFQRDLYSGVREERRSISTLPVIRAFANKGSYKTFRCNEIGDCVRCSEWINRNRLSDIGVG